MGLALSILLRFLPKFSALGGVWESPNELNVREFGLEDSTTAR